jgi:hypothetical protein
MLRLVRQIHSCSGRGELLGHFIRSLAIIGALILVHSHPLSALQDEQQTKAAQTAVVEPEAAAAQTDAVAEAADSSGSEDLDVQVEVVPSDQKGDSKLLVQLDGDHTGTAVEGGSPAVSDLPPGRHTARLILLDGKRHGARGGHTTVHFRVHATPAAEASNSAAPQLRGAAPAAPPIPEELRDTPDPSINLKGSPLPVIAFIGFLLLISGFLPTIRARKVTRIVHP